MRSTYKPSIIQTKCECYLCKADYRNGLEVHHAIPGRGNRKICTDLGLTVWLCPNCHRNLHDKGIGYKEIQMAAQKAYIVSEKKKGIPEEVVRATWYERFMKFYD